MILIYATIPAAIVALGFVFTHKTRPHFCVGRVPICHSDLILAQVASFVNLVDNIDFATFNFPFIGEELQFYSKIETDGYTITASENIYVCGKCGVYSSNGTAYGEIDNAMVLGIPYQQGSSAVQSTFCVPLAKGQTLRFHFSGTASVENLSLRRMTYPQNT